MASFETSSATGTLTWFDDYLQTEIATFSIAHITMVIFDYAKLTAKLHIVGEDTVSTLTFADLDSLKQFRKRLARNRK